MRNYWYVAATSAEVTTKPLAVTILDEPIVLFRDSLHLVGALVDRCPHRNVQLSRGNVSSGGLVCAYHGWTFDRTGRCVSIPSLCAGDSIPSGATATSYPVMEQDGYIWVFIGDREPGDRLPPRLDHHDEPGWHTARFATTIKNSYENCVENFIDCPHTGYIHGGLFRTPASHQAHTTVRRSDDGVIVEIDEETQTDSFLGRLLVPKGGKVEHIDRFIMPSTVRVAYKFRPGREVIGYQLCTPVGPLETKVFVYVTWRLGAFGGLLTPLVGLIGRKIMGQDVGILENQAQVVRRHGERFVSTAADTANVWIRAFREQAAAAEGQPDGVGREKRVSFRL